MTRMLPLSVREQEVAMMRRTAPFALLSVVISAFFLQWIGTSPFPRGSDGTVYSAIVDFFQW